MANKMPKTPSMPPGAKAMDMHDCIANARGRLRLTYRACAVSSQTYLKQYQSGEPIPKRVPCSTCTLGLSAAKRLKISRIVRTRASGVEPARCS